MRVVGMEHKPTKKVETPKLDEVVEEITKKVEDEVVEEITENKKSSKK